MYNLVDEIVYITTCVSKRSITGTPLKSVCDQIAVTICGSSYGNNAACKVLKNSHIKLGGVLHTNV